MKDNYTDSVYKRLKEWNLKFHNQLGESQIVYVRNKKSMNDGNDLSGLFWCRY